MSGGIEILILMAGNWQGQVNSTNIRLTYSIFIPAAFLILYTLKGSCAFVSEVF